MKHALYVFVIRTLLWRIVLLLCKTLNIKFYNQQAIEKLRNNNEKYVVAFWHGSMIVGWFIHRPKKKEKISALVSQSKDGEYLSTMLAQWGLTMIRGSSHIGGKEAMQLMNDAIVSGSSLAITPDGPTGPRHRMKMGAVRLAQKTNTPLLLCGIAMAEKKQLRSWDKFEIPKPFTKIAVCYSNPITVPPELQGESLNLFLLETEKQMIELNESAERNL